MFCPECGKEISDDSKFCYSCGSKIEIKEKQDTIKDTSPIVVDKEKTSETKDIKQTISEKKDEPVILSTDQTTLPEKKNKFSFGLLILLLFYGSFISKWFKDNQTDIPIITTIVIL